MGVMMVSRERRGSADGAWKFCWFRETAMGSSVYRT